VVRACRDATRKAKAHLELNLTRDFKDNKKGFFNYISSKRKARDNVGPLLKQMGVLLTENAKTAELLNAFFASVFSAKAGPQESQAPEVREEAYREDDFPLVAEDCVRDRLRDLDVHESMGPDGMHPRVLRELVGVVAEPLSIIFERSWRTERKPVSLQSKKGQEGGSRELQAGQPHLHSRKDDGTAHSGGHHQASGGKEGYQE